MREGARHRRAGAVPWMPAWGQIEEVWFRVLIGLDLLTRV